MPRRAARSLRTLLLRSEPSTTPRHGISTEPLEDVLQLDARAEVCSPGLPLRRRLKTYSACLAGSGAASTDVWCVALLPWGAKRAGALCADAGILQSSKPRPVHPATPPSGVFGPWAIAAATVRVKGCAFCTHHESARLLSANASVVSSCRPRYRAEPPYGCVTLRLQRGCVLVVVAYGSVHTYTRPHTANDHLRLRSGDA